jgi:L-threonylcarbamoyladenylate synthase
MRHSLRTAADGERLAPLVRAHVEQGGLVAYPTETVYGLGSAVTATGLAALARLKGRQPDKPFLMLVGNLEMLEETGLVLSPSARALAREFWPGPLTLVLPGGTATIPDAMRGPEGGVAVRWTSHPALAAMLQAMQLPITSTSANRPGGPTAPGMDGITQLFPEAIADGTLLLLDGGVLGNVPPSTLVDCTAPLPRMVREGAIPRRELRRRVGSLAP